MNRQDAKNAKGRGKPTRPSVSLHVTGADRRALERFYETVFGRAAVGPLGRGPIVVSALGGAERPEAAAPSVFVTVADLDRALTRAEHAGGEVTVWPLELPARAGRVAAIRDPAGNELSLWEGAPKPRRTRGAPKAGARVRKR